MKTLMIMIAVSLLSNPSYSQNTDSILNHYLTVKDALVKSDYDAAKINVALLQKTIEKSSTFLEKENLLKTVQKMAKAADIEKLRLAFAEVSPVMWKLVKRTKISQSVYYQYCPMKKAYWISTEAVIKNPYYGSKMLSCGNIADKKLK